MFFLIIPHDRKFLSVSVPEIGPLAAKTAGLPSEGRERHERSPDQTVDSPAGVARNLRERPGPWRRRCLNPLFASDVSQRIETIC